MSGLLSCRNVALFHKFIGQSNSRGYVEYCSHKFEYWARIVLLILYIASCGIIFGKSHSSHDQRCALPAGDCIRRRPPSARHADTSVGFSVRV